jgi:hypothetical protein
VRIKIYLTSVRIVIIGFVFNVGVIAGTIAINNTFAQTEKQSEKPSSTAQVPPKDENGNTVFPKNKNGKTYGSAADATSPENEPELIKAWGVDGNLGYVRSSDLYGEKPNTPEEAIAKQNKQTGDIVIPLYDSNGENIIGSFKISAPTVVTQE